MWGEESHNSQEGTHMFSPCQMLKYVQMEKLTEVAEQLAMQAWGFIEKQSEHGTPKPTTDDC